MTFEGQQIQGAAKILEKLQVSKIMLQYVDNRLINFPFSR